MRLIGLWHASSFAWYWQMLTRACQLSDKKARLLLHINRSQQILQSPAQLYSFARRKQTLAIGQLQGREAGMHNFAMPLRSMLHPGSYNARVQIVRFQSVN